MVKRTVIDVATQIIRRARALLFCSGAGMGVDSGLPDFRGTEGFWRAYPAFATLGLRFEELANPTWFSRDPALAWGFYGHRLNLYRATMPHNGYHIVKHLADSMPLGAFSITSNVDGQLQRAGFDESQIVEVHGTILAAQCSRPCSRQLWKADFQIAVDPDTFRATSELPRCARCNAIARPNILMFGDSGFVGDRTEAQQARLSNWLNACPLSDVAIIECGAGTGVPTVRALSESLSRRGARLIRINPREGSVPAGQLGIAANAKETLQAIALAMA